MIWRGGWRRRKRSGRDGRRHIDLRTGANQSSALSLVKVWSAAAQKCRTRGHLTPGPEPAVPWKQLYERVPALARPGAERPAYSGLAGSQQEISAPLAW